VKTTPNFGVTIGENQKSEVLRMRPSISHVTHVPREPVADRQPFKVDVFELVIRNLGLLQLAPIFPYLHDGAIVPCMTNTTGVKGVTPWHFFHANDVRETIICLVENGGAMKSGQIMLLANNHGVGPFLRDANDPTNYYVGLITIRMRSEPRQMEGIIMRCQKCNEIIYERRFNVKEGPERKYYPEFYALRYYEECWNEFNSSEERRTCKKCGTVRPPETASRDFGHMVYARNIEVANWSRESFEQMAARLVGKTDQASHGEKAA
jgi:RNase P subunit RPR2